MKKIGLLLGGLAVALDALDVMLEGADACDDVVAQLKKQMGSANIPDATINCVADGMIAKFGTEKLGSNDALTAEETAAAQQIGADCVKSTMAVTTTVVAP